jgi:5-methylcytosine-specific restriction endonuclease McrA
MPTRSCSQLSDGDLTRHLHGRVAEDSVALADLLALIAEFDRRRLFAPAGFTSMYAYCVRRLHFSEYSAYKRIAAARAARKFPAILESVACGEIHLSAVRLLAPHLTKANVSSLLAAAKHRTKAEVELLVAEHFPRHDVPTSITPVAATAAPQESLTMTPNEQAVSGEPERSVASIPAPVQLAPGPVSLAAAKPRIAPLAPERYVLQLTIGGATREKLRRAQEMLRHRLPSGDAAEVIDRALDALLAQLEKEKYAATDKPRAPRAAGSNPRQIPAHVKRAVRERDGGCCTFVGEDGQRCESRDFLEFDHVIPVAHGGESTIENLRQRCRAHNQHEAERVFGSAFMNERRERRQSETEAQREIAENARAAAMVSGMSDEDRATAVGRARAAVETITVQLRATSASATQPGAAAPPAA